MMPNILTLAVAGDTSEVTSYTVAPCRCTLKSIQAACDADPGDAETITVKAGSDTVGVLTYGADIVAGATGTYVADSTNGNHVFDEGDVVTLVVSALTAAANFNGYLEIDEFARIDS